MDLDLAFRMGYAFASGMRFGERIRSLAEDKKNGWITINGTHAYVRNGRLVGRMAAKIHGTNLSPGRLSYKRFLKENPQHAAEPNKTGARKAYVKEVFHKLGPSTEVNMRIQGGKKAQATSTGMSVGEMGGKLREKDRDAVPFTYEILREGRKVGEADAPKESHRKKGIRKFHYFQKKVPIKGHRKTTQVDLAEMEPFASPQFRPYVISVKGKKGKGRKR